MYSVYEKYSYQTEQVNESHILMTGGFAMGANPGYMMKTYFFNWDTKSWSTGADMNFGRNSHKVRAKQDIFLATSYN